MNESDRIAIDLLTLDLAPDDDGYRSLGRCSEIGLAALLLAQDDTALEAVYDAAPQYSPAMRLLMHVVRSGEPDAPIRQILSDTPRFLGDLCRCDVGWDHDDLHQLLDDPQARFDAGLMLARIEPERLFSWFEFAEDPDDIVAMARLAATAEAVSIFEVVASCHAPVAQQDPVLGARLEAAVFLLSPLDWSVSYVRGRFGADFLDDSESVADMVSWLGSGVWASALAAFEPGTDEFDLLARAMAASVGAIAYCATEGDLPDDFVEAIDEGNWEQMRQHGAFRVATVLAEDDDTQELLMQIAAHELLKSQGLASRGIDGFPLSSTAPTPDAVDAAHALMRDAEAEPLAVVATVCDALELSMLPEYAALSDFLSAVSHADPLVAAAIQRLEPRDIAAQAELAGGTDLNALAASVRLALGSEPAALELIRLWADGPLIRSHWFAGLVAQAITYPRDS